MIFIKGFGVVCFLITFEKLWHDNPHYEDEYFGQTVLQLKVLTPMTGLPQNCFILKLSRF
ncbi:MAG: hypothetical protein KIIPBIDF_02064 [Candidatus Methanoperedenaceae archaeon GB50]|nr:MAG: hypothetical protein KIIPBIDF_02064 [Candidatus Methanoperedenaceae archaeon GB50]